MKYKKTNTLVGMNYNALERGLGKWANITQQDISEIVMTPVGTMYMKKYLDDLYNKTYENTQKEYQIKLMKAEDQIAAMWTFIIVEAIEALYEKFKLRNDKRGWQKTHLTKEDVIAGMIEEIGEAQKKMDEEYANVVAEKIRNEYGVELVFDSVDLNHQFGFDQFLPYENEDIFKNMTAWEIYELGYRNGDVASRVVTSVSMAGSLKEDKRFTPPIINKFFKRANEITKEILVDQEKLNKTIRDLEKIKFVLPESWKRVFNDFIDHEAAYNDRWLWEALKK